MLNYLVFDWETTSRNSGDDYVGKPSENGKSGGPSPYHPLNCGVSVGWTTGGEQEYGEIYGYHSSKQPALAFYQHAKLLVGHNIRFDLMYTIKHYPEFYDWLWDNDVKIWDTQQAEYLLSGQSVIMPSLQDCCTRNDMEGKHDEVSDMFKAGIQAQDIDPAILLSYMKQDVLQTEQLFLIQYQKAQELGMLPLIESQMSAMLATFEMQLNGMAFDYNLAQEYANEIRGRQQAIQQQIHNVYTYLHPHIPEKDISVGSNDFLSRALYGGAYKYKKKVDTGELYKNGNPKLRVKEFQALVTGYLQHIKLPERAKVPVKKLGYYEVNDDVLKRLRNYDPKADMLIDLVLSYRQNNKDLTTYYQGFSDMAYTVHNDPCSGGTQYYIHGNLNHAVTATGRLSSSKPNLQNLSGKAR